MQVQIILWSFRASLEIFILFNEIYSEARNDKKVKLMIMILGSLLMMIACTPPKQPSPLTLPKPLRPPMVEKNEVSTLTAKTTQVIKHPQTQFQTTPSLPISQSFSTLTTEEKFPPFSTKGPLKVALEELPLPAFINEVFGNLLGLSFEINNRVQSKRDLVTLRITEPQSPEQLYKVALQVLANYGVGVESQGNFMRFVPGSKQSTSVMPSLIATGATLPEVPPSHRPIFQLVPLKVVRQTEVKRWISKIFQDNNLQVLEDTPRNAMVLIGPPQLVIQATEVISVLDQPTMRGRYSLRIDPAFLTADVLANKLLAVLQAQGYAASNTSHSGSMIILPIEEVNAVIVFAADKTILEHVRQWANQLDRLNLQKTDNKPGIFFYAVKNTAAASLAESLNNLVRQITKTTPQLTQATNKKTPLQPQTQSVSQFAVDQHRNALLFTGTAEQWAQLFPILQEMDKPVKQVLIEATIAEITLSDQDERGIEWVINNANLGGLTGQLGTLERLAVGQQGLTYTLSSAGQVRAILNAFASSSRATILQTPRLLVRSGSSASIEVGNEIPILSSQASAPDLQQNGSSSILQNIQYRRTGISLSIEPIVYAGRRIDLQISQKVSNDLPNSTSNIDSPVIFNRQISTQLSLSDGQSVLLGGLISESRSEGEAGIPILSDIPILGQLFRTNKQSSTRNELIILIIPYVIDDAQEAKAISEAIKQRLELLPFMVPNESSSTQKKNTEISSPPNP